MKEKKDISVYQKVAFWGRLKKSYTKPADISAKLDNYIKILTVVLTAASVFIGVWEFNRQQASNDAEEFKRKIWEKRLNAYMELGSLTAKMVTEINDSLFNSEAKEFDQLYWGKLPLFDDDKVEAALKNFRNKVRDHQKKEEDVYSPDILKITGYQLIKVCQKSLKNSWKQLDDH